MPIDGDIILKAGLDTEGVSKKMDDLQKSLKRGFKTLIKYTFGVRSFFFLYRKIRKAVSEGFGDLAKVNEPFNQSMSQLMTSLNLLKNTVAAAFAPLVETVAPILSQFINSLAEAISKVGQFIAALTGKEYIKAGSAYVDYAKSLDKSSASSSKATKQTKKQTEAQKKLNREITHFDDLVILHEKHDNENTTPNSNTAPSATFTTAPIGDAISKFAADFKAAWARADFTNIGRQVGEKLKSMLEHIPWEKIQAGTRKIAHSIATFLNGFLETPGLFTEIGETIGDAINTVLAGLSTYAWTFHWDSLGTAVKDAINGALRKINWDDAFSAAEGFGRGFAQYLNALINPETFGLIGETLANVLNTAFTFLATFGEEFDWVNFGVSLATGLNTFLENLDIEEFSKGVKAFVYGIRDSIVTFLSGTNWEKFGQTLRDIILAIPWTTLLKSFGEIIWYAIKAVIRTAKAIFTGDDTVGKPVVDAFNNLQRVVDSIADEVDFDAIAEGFGAVVKALQPAAEGFAVGFINVFTKLFEIGKDFLEKLGPALQGIADAINELDPELLKTIGENFGIFAASLLVLNGISGIFTTIGGFFTTVSGAASGVATATSAFGGWFGQILSGLGVTAALNTELNHIRENEENLEKATSDTGFAFAAVTSALNDAGIKGDFLGTKLTKVEEPLSLMQDELPDFKTTFEQVTTEFENAGGNVDAFKQSLQTMLDSGQLGQKEAKIIQDYIGDIGEKSVDAKTDTTDFAGAFDAFEGLSIATPLKMLLISGAIKALGEKGTLSNEQVGDLITTLDEADMSHPEEALGKVKTAFENAGISADDFNTSINTAFSKLPGDVKADIQLALAEIENSGDDIKDKSEEAFKNVDTGAKKGIEDNSGEVVEAAETMVENVLAGAGSAMDANSPSKEMEKRGKWFDEGFRDGIKNNESIAVTAAGNLANKAKTEVDKYKTDFYNSGSALSAELYKGINSHLSSLGQLGDSLGDAVYSNVDSHDWYDLGDNIGTGIYNGLFANKSWLKTLAWNTAVDMYNAACEALGIASPSKKFAWIGQMTMQGLGKGVLDNEDTAVNAVADVAGAMSDEAEKSNPVVAISTSIDSWINALDDVLTKFSETVINRFDNLVNTLAILGTMSGAVPAVAQGKVIPSSIISSNNADESTNRMLSMLDNLTSNQLSYDDLREILVEMFDEHMRMDFYLGDEQIARHANNGNLLLNRRYSIIK